MNVINHVAAKIQELRTSYGGRGISQEELAKAMGKSTNTVSRWETATYKPSIEDLYELARFFKISILEFFPAETLEETIQKQTDDRIMPLLRAAEDLTDNDLKELRQYAEYRRARHLLESQDKPRPGRKRKG
jgi:transcriptional regulator with XRE-family HTH domain